MINPCAFRDNLVASGYKFFTGVPDSLLSDFCKALFAPEFSGCHVTAANEGNAVAMACGSYLATGRPALVYMQNSGEGNAINPLLSLADESVYAIPLLLLIGWRGEPGYKDEPQHSAQGRLTTEILDTIGIEYLILDDNYQKQIEYINEYFKNKRAPFALIVKKGTFFNDSALSFPSTTLGQCQMTRESALETILNCIDNESCIVTTTGKTSRELFELREARGEGHEHDFLTVGSMGHASSIAYGIACESSKDVYCIDGDGAFLMHAGALAIIGQSPRKNFKYILNLNGSHESVGGQPTAAQGIDFRPVLYAFGFEEVYRVQTKAELEEALHKLVGSVQMAALIIETKPGSRTNLGRPTATPCENKNAFMSQFLNGGEAK